MSADRIAHPWGARTPYGKGAPWPVRVDPQLAEGRHGGGRRALGARGSAATAGPAPTTTSTTPASKQPTFKTGAAALGPA
ncbi:hypothetical protein [Pseudonocardia sp. NPDC049154]|uniref:hypothetical protein n=1 Tax=Pseudonocardia sp. NPDC049154 TaxID=3155501 RepID=UPI003407FAC4